MVNIFNHTQHETTMKNSSAQDWVYKKLEELKYAINWDTFNLTRGQQSRLETKVDELKKMLDEEYCQDEY